MSWMDDRERAERDYNRSKKYPLWIEIPVILTIASVILFGWLWVLPRVLEWIGFI